MACGVGASGLGGGGIPPVSDGAIAVGGGVPDDVDEGVPAIDGGPDVGEGAPPERLAPDRGIAGEPTVRSRVTAALSGLRAIESAVNPLCRCAPCSSRPNSSADD